MNIFRSISNWYDNGIYYPEQFLIVMCIFIILTVIILSYCFYKSYKILKYFYYLRRRSKFTTALKDKYVKKLGQYPTLVNILDFILNDASKFYEFVISTKNKISNYAVRNPVTIFTTVLFIMIFMRVWTTYITESRVVIAPEKIFQSLLR